MKRKILCTLLAAMLVLTMLAGCGDTVSDIAGNVSAAAKAELEKQIKATLDKYKVDVVEMKTQAGKLNGEGKNLQFFCAVLVKSNSDSLPQSCADALGKVFDEAGVVVQTGSQVESPYLEHKQITYKTTDFSDGGYYTIYVYKAVIEADSEG